MKKSIQFWIIIMTLAGGTFIWIFDAFIDYLSMDGSFLDVFIHDVSRHELYTRIVYLLSFLVFGIVLLSLVNRIRRSDKEKESFITAVANSNNGIAFTDSDDKYVYVNSAFAELYGYSSAEIRGKTCIELVPKDLGSKAEHILRDMLHDRKVGYYTGESLALKHDGQTIPIELRAKSFWSDEGEYLGHTCIVHDITEEKTSKEKIEQSERFLSTIFNSIRDPFMILDRNYNIVKANNAYSELKHISLDDLIGEACYRITRNRTSVCEDCIVAKTFLSGDPSAKEKRVTLFDGTYEWLEIYTYPILDDKGTVTHVIEYVRNITDRKKTEEDRQKLIENLEVLSSVDSLTGLINRRILFDRLKYELKRSQRYGLELSLMFCDLDFFKEINDTHGHKTGDDVLKGIADIMKQSLRVTDIAGRYGGDEFLIVLPQTTLKGANELAERIRHSVQQKRFQLPDGRETGTTMSIGITHYDGKDNVDDLLSRIDTALYESKKSGKNQVYSLI